MIVIKIGGRVVKNSLDKVVDDIVNIKEKLILIHGGGDIVTEYSKKMGIEPTFVTSPEGIKSRYTSREELDIYVMTMSLINKQIVSKLLSLGKNTIGISGVDGGLLIAERKKKIVIIDERGKKRLIDGGYTGKVKEIRGDVINNLLMLFDAIILSPFALDIEEKLPLNIDADQAAFAISKAVKPETLVMLSDVEGVLVDNKVINKLTAEEARELASKIGPGMNRKLLMSAEAIENGIGKVIIASGMKDNPISNALQLKGTVITNA
ncbi:acetylglutamate kinase [Sulfolobus sp. A20]|uniref:[LysW]-aminoadipate/[LysW]-glutamate kinase n=1 Tax=Saccharolobus sp. A20 TaxID=1891280 RepID=UPI000845F4FF|nr:[LysW]-aminoadipate/[LysW]-glutamate kinase [Sulfolobus sp. A20]TRM74814.1 acetylglutamate kinase [Sulfolobus sp. A20-N-F8]TRM78015.1 acetylglutamate kinase [Sulfolobus sp. B5]TRM82536.1 acetylglutamate kinase [Sulfolobus sp. D5]TRM87872.1 acetylglutamate kinase [Sulfolobus sp. C3]TRM98022.1 acetylglutamate kinase [Sulfolobus sp. E1]TRN01568.1 acetylglutamate kinase [Sulfolobus sp. F1]